MAFRLANDPNHTTGPIKRFDVKLPATAILALPPLYWAITGCLPVGPHGACIPGTPAAGISALLMGVVVAHWLHYSTRVRQSTWAEYDPTWLVDLAVSELPEEKWLSQALLTCTRSVRQPTQARVVFFVDPCEAGVPSAEWAYQESLVFESHPDGPVVLEILKDHRIGSVTKTWLGTSSTMTNPRY